MSKLSPYFLAIDQGGHASRAIVFDGRGRIIAEAGVDISTARLPGERVEHDADALIESIERAVRDVGGRFDGAIAAAGLAIQRSSIVCWDRRSGEALSPVISWQDRRAADWLKQFDERAADIQNLTGLVLSPHYGASKLRWCLDHLPAVRQALAENRLCCGPLASFVLFRLLDSRPFVVDPANGSRTLLWDCSTRNWSPGLLELFGVPMPVLPRCVPTRHDYGMLSFGGRAVPLTVCTGDQSAALFAFGEPQRDTVCINAGTGAFLQRAVGGARIRSTALLGSVVWQSDDELSYVLEGTVNGAGSALRHVGADLGIAVDELDRAVAGALDTAEPMPFLNGVSGLGSPYWRADFRSRFLGTGGIPEKLAGVAESIVFLIAVNLEEMARAAGPVRRIVLTGGLASMDGLCRRLADLSGLPVERPVIREATARGLAWLTAGRPAAWLEDGKSECFAPGSNPALQRRFERWRAALVAALD